MATYSADERRTLTRRLEEGEPLECPACGGPVSRQPVQRPDEVAYVRRRVWILCATCHRSGAVDLPHD